MSEEINARVNFIPGKTDGLKTLSTINKEIEAAKKDITAIAKAGGIDAIAGDSRQLNIAKTQIELIGVQLDGARVKAEMASKSLADADEGTAAWRKATNQLAEANAQTAKLSASLDQTVTDFKRASNAADDYGDKMRVVRDQTESLGDADSALMAVSGLASGLGAGGIAEAGMIGSDILATAEALPKLGASIVDLGSKASALPGILGASATAASGLAASGGATTAALAGIAGAIAPIAAVAAAAGAALVGLNAIIKDANDEAQRAYDIRRREYEQNIELVELQYSKTREQILEEIAYIEDRNAVIEKSRDAEVDALAEIDHGLRGLQADIYLFGGGPVRDMRDALKEYNTELDNNQTRIDTLNMALETGSYIAEEAENSLDGFFGTLADGAIGTVSKITDDINAGMDMARNATIAGISEQASLEQERQRILREGTVEGIQDQMQTQRDLIEEREREIDLLEQASDGSEQFNDAIRSAQSELQDAQEQLDFLQNSALATAQANEAAAQSEEDVKAAREKTVAINERLAADITKIQDAQRQKTESAERKHAQKLEDIALDAARDAEDRLRDLENERVNIIQDASRNAMSAERDAEVERADMRISAQREEAKALRDHQRNIAKIRRDAEDREFIQIAERNFAALFESRRSTSRQISEAGISAGAESEERRIATAEQRADFERQLAREREQRQIELQQRINDARAAFEQERNDAAISRQRALQDANISRQREIAEAQRYANEQLRIRREAAQAELQMIADAAQQRINIEAQAQNALISAFVNPINALISSVRNLSSSPSVTMNMTNNITGRDPEATARFIDTRVDRRLGSIMGVR